METLIQQLRQAIIAELEALGAEIPDTVTIQNGVLGEMTISLRD